MNEVIRKHADLGVLEYVRAVMTAHQAAEMRWDEALRMLRVTLGLPLQGEMQIDFATGDVVVTVIEPLNTMPPPPPEFPAPLGA